MLSATLTTASIEPSSTVKNANQDIKFHRFMKALVLRLNPACSGTQLMEAVSDALKDTPSLPKEPVEIQVAANCLIRHQIGAKFP